MMASQLSAFALAGMLICALVHADDVSDALAEGGPLYEISTGVQETDGRLHVYPWAFSKTWLNSARVSDADYDLVLKPGDMVDSFVCGDFTEVRQYRLESLSPTRAVFTLWYFAAVRTRLDDGSVRYQKGGRSPRRASRWI